MTIPEIKYLYDSNPNMTLDELSKITNLDISELQFILTCTDEDYVQ
jgi:hypothetical protein